MMDEMRTARKFAYVRSLCYYFHLQVVHTCVACFPFACHIFKRKLYLYWSFDSGFVKIPIKDHTKHTTYSYETRFAMLFNPYVHVRIFILVSLIWFDFSSLIWSKGGGLKNHEHLDKKLQEALRIKSLEFDYV